MSKPASLTVTVTEADAGIRLDRWFSRHYKGVPHALLEKHLRKGLIRLDNKKSRSADRIEAGQEITLPQELKQATSATPHKTPLHEVDARAVKELQSSVLYKDAHMLIINKPAGLAVQGGSGQKHHLDGMLDHLRFDAAERPRLVHRLDKDTSGVLVLARTSKAAAELAKRFAGRDVQKTYHALVVGMPKPTMDTIRLKLIKQEGLKFETMKVDPKGMSATTNYRVIETLGQRLSWMELVPVTGRTHQLRVHMAAIGHPIVSDGKYGGREAFIRGIDLPKQLHLHAESIRIPDWHGKDVEVHAPLPAHMKESRTLLGMD